MTRVCCCCCNHTTLSHAKALEVHPATRGQDHPPPCPKRCPPGPGGVNTKHQLPLLPSWQPSAAAAPCCGVLETTRLVPRAAGSLLVLRPCSYSYQPEQNRTNEPEQCRPDYVHGPPTPVDATMERYRWATIGSWRLLWAMYWSNGLVYDTHFVCLFANGVCNFFQEKTTTVSREIWTIIVYHHFGKSTAQTAAWYPHTPKSMRHTQKKVKFVLLIRGNPRLIIYTTKKYRNMVTT